MGSGNSKKSTQKQPKPEDKVAKPKADTASIPKQVSDSNDVLDDTKHDIETKGNIVVEIDKSTSDNENKPEVFLTEVPEPWMDILNEVADSEIWPRNKRSERPEWRENLAKADELFRSEKIPISVKTKTAVYNGDLVIPDLPDMSKKVLVFVSSTFTDTKAERNNLMTDVYPYVREVCRRLGLEFGTIDMRWGVTDEATKHHSTVKMCLDEIQRCVNESYGPAFLCILGHKYGYRPIPAAIEESEFERILACLINNKHDTSLLKKFYQLDKNSTKPEYVLRSMSDDEGNSKWWEDVEFIQEQIRNAVLECFSNKPDIYEKYFVSVTEMEIQEGTFKNSKRDDQSHFMMRELTDIDNKINHNRRLRDMKGSEVDVDAYDRLQCLKQKKLPENLRKQNIITFTYESATAKGGMHYVSRFCDQICRTMVQMIFDNFQNKGNVENDPDVIEIVQHLKLAEEKRSLFVGRDKELSTINKYLKDMLGENKPLVISGSSGSGKTALMAVSAGKGKAISKKSVNVVRFIGTTSQSGSVRNLLLSVCRQIAFAYSQDVGLIPESTRELTDYFRNSLSNATKISPLIIHLDSLDQLSADDNGRKLEWLKLDQDLPKHVKLILSSLEADTLSVLRKYVPDDNFINMVKLLPGEGPDILQTMMKVKGRKVTEPQLKVVMDAFLNTPLPLYLSLASDIACKWKSYDDIDSTDISTTIKGMITLLFERLEKKFGVIFVSHALAYITASKHGLSQNELEDILSCDDEVLDSLFQYWTPPMRRIPPLLWIRVRKELGQYLSERGSDGATVFTWFHRQFRETSYERYLEQSDMKPNAHIALADYFDGKWIGGKEYFAKTSKSSDKPVLKDRGLPRQPLTYGDGAMVFNNINRRKIRELPYHLIKVNDTTRISKLFFDLEYIETKFRAGMGHEFYIELSEATKIDEDRNMIEMVRFVGSNLSFLLREPCSIYQLASQQNKSHTARQQLEQIKKLPVTILKNSKASNETSHETCELTLQGHEKSPLSCDFSPKGDRIVSTSVDGCLRIWDVLTGSEIAVYTSLPSHTEKKVNENGGHGMNMRVHTANPCCFSRNGETIAVGTEDGEIDLFDTDGSKLKSEPTENDSVTCLQFSRDNNTIVAGFKNGNLCVFNSDTLELCKTLQLENEIFDLDLSQDGTMLAVVMRFDVANIQMDDLLISWEEMNIPSNNSQKRTRRAARPELVLCCCYDPTGQHILTGSADNTIAVWEADSGECVNKLAGHSAWIWSIKMTKDGMYMFSSSSDRSIKLWKKSTNNSWQTVSTFYGHSHRVVCSAMDTLESRLVTSSLDCTLKVWNIKAMTQTTSTSDDEPAESKLHFNTLAISPSALHIALSNGWSRTCSIQNIDSNDGNDILETKRHRGFIKKAEFTSDGSKLVVIDHGHTGDYLAKAALNVKCSVYNATDCERLHDLHIDSDDGPTSFSCCRTYIAVGTHLGKILMFDIGTYETTTSWEWEPDIVQITCSFEGDHVVTATGSQCSVWKIKGNKQSLISDLPEHESSITTAIFSPNGLTFVTGVESGKIYVWNVIDNSVKLYRTLTGHTASVKDISFSKSGHFMVTCGDLSARVWDVKNGYVQKGVYYAPINCVVFKSEQEILAGDAVGELNKLCFE